MTVRNQPSAQGLARVCQGPRGYVVKFEGEDVGKVYAHLGFDKNLHGTWYWVAHSKDGRVPLKNTCAVGLSKEAARDACVAYVKECLAKAGVK